MEIQRSKHETKIGEMQGPWIRLSSRNDVTRPGIKLSARVSVDVTGKRTGKKYTSDIRCVL
jgi:hypothetical protein